jgi:hypothetical protein
MRTTERGGEAEQLFSPLVRYSRETPRCQPRCSASLAETGCSDHDDGAAPSILARPWRGRTPRPKPYVCHLRRLEVDADDPGSTAQDPTDDAHRFEYVAACYQATTIRSAALGKRRHRGRYQRSRDALDGRAVLFCERRRSWMRIGPSCGTESRGQRRSRTGGRASGQE